MMEFEKKADSEPDDLIKLKLRNINSVRIYLFEIDTVKSIDQLKRLDGWDIDLQNKTPQREYIFKFKESPFKVHYHETRLELIKEWGVWVVKCVIDKKISRMVIRRGKLILLQHP